MPDIKVVSNSEWQSDRRQEYYRRFDQIAREMINDKVVQVIPSETESKRTLKRWLAQYIRSHYGFLLEFADKDDGTFLVRRRR